MGSDIYSLHAQIRSNVHNFDFEIRRNIHHPNLPVQAFAFTGAGLPINRIGTDENAVRLGSVFVSSSNPIDKETCTYKGKRLYGNVRVVDYSADFEVRLIQYGADLDVKIEAYSANHCGEWHFVNAGEDFTVRFVDTGGDFTVHFVEYNPGVQ